jgi:hypothetical protein
MVEAASRQPDADRELKNHHVQEPDARDVATPLALHSERSPLCDRVVRFEHNVLIENGT